MGFIEPFDYWEWYQVFVASDHANKLILLGGFPSEPTHDPILQISIYTGIVPIEARLNPLYEYRFRQPVKFWQIWRG